MHPSQFGLIGLVLLATSASFRKKLPFPWELLLLGYALLLAGFGQYWALFDSPPDRMMGDVVRILHVHVPAAWTSMFCFFLAFIGSLAYLFTEKPELDWFSEAANEIGCLLSILLLITGALFGRPTWGGYWSWDPRLTASAVMMLSFVGVMLLRTSIAEPDTRARWCSAATLVAFFNIPLVWFSVKWFASLHQIQSNSKTTSPEIWYIMLFNGWMFLFLSIFFIARRWRIAKMQFLLEAPPPLPPVNEVHA